jgi:hypothetical protein
VLLFEGALPERLAVHALDTPIDYRLMIISCHVNSRFARTINFCENVEPTFSTESLGKTNRQNSAGSQKTHDRREGRS